MEIVKWAMCLFWYCEDAIISTTTPAVTQGYDFEISRTELPVPRQDMEIVKWALCLFWYCEDALNSTTAPAVTQGYDLEISRTELPVPRQGCNLSGYWYNELGSEAYLKVAKDGFIEGEYRTSIEYSYGAAGDGPSYVFGTSNEDGNTFGFTVVWKGYNDTSVTSWVGVCDVCDGQAILKTSWVLQSLGKKQCEDRNKWTGENTFTRTEQRPGPRRAENTHNPRDFQHRYRSMERNWEI